MTVRSTDGAALLVGWTHDEWAEDSTTNYYSEMGGVLIETGAVAPPPTPAPVASGSGASCGATESFLVTSVDLPEIEGCFQATSASYSTDSNVEVWTISGELNLEEVAIFGTADDGTEDTVSPKACSTFEA